MSERRILVTGASGAVGRAICERLAQQGVTVVAWGRNKERLVALQKTIGEDSCIFQSVDLLDRDAVGKALAKINEGEPIDGFVHAAAAPLKFVPVNDQANLVELQTHWEINVLSFQQVAQALVPLMQEGGGIVVVLTQAILDLPPLKLSAYVAAKASCLGLVKSYAAECGPHGIRCNAVSPNMMDTPYTADFSIRAKQIEAASNPMRRLCHPDDVAEAVFFLLSPRASYINGVNLPITGGSRMP